MGSLRRRLFTAIAIFIVFSINCVAYAESNNLEKAKGVILMIGDGMGINQVKSAEIYSRAILGQDLSISSIETSGLTTTHAANSKVTDSAAAATALYSGYKTDTGKLNILPDGRKVFNVATAAKNAGMSVGVVSTTRVTDATPAAIYSNSPRRDCEAYIAGQLPEFSPDVILGGGGAYFVPSSQKGSKRTDQKDIIELMKGRGYGFVENNSELKAVNPKTVDKLFGLFSTSNMAFAIDREHHDAFSAQPSLADMTKVALSIVGKNPKGFFIMIEGGRIDHACHLHDIKTMITETLDFDAAVGAALSYQKTHPDVLVIVTADHETGGLTPAVEGTEFSVEPQSLVPIKKSLDFVANKIKKDPERQDAILKSAGLDLTEDESTLFRNNQTKAVEEKPSGNKNTAKPKFAKSATMEALSVITSARAKVNWTTFGHTEQPVMTKAVGPGAQLFSGNYDNTDIAKKIAEILNLSLPGPSLERDETSIAPSAGGAATCP
ncbi:MAG: alkaline phosphatase [Pseudomonadota bacterium]